MEIKTYVTNVRGLSRRTLTNILKEVSTETDYIAAIKFSTPKKR